MPELPVDDFERNPIVNLIATDLVELEATVFELRAENALLRALLASLQSDAHRDGAQHS